LIKSVLAIGAHPDDELSIAGLLIHMVKLGIKVHLLFFTRGENGPRGFPPVAPNVPLGRIRAAEAVSASGIIGAESIDFLNYVDIGYHDVESLGPAHDPDVASREIREHIVHCKANVVFTHGSDGDYGHPAHLLTHRMTLKAVQEIVNKKPLVYSWDAWWEGYDKPERLNRSDSAHALLNVEQYLPLVLAMGRCHRTQSSTWHYRKEQKRGCKLTFEEIWHNQPVLSIHRHVPQVELNKLPEDELMIWLKEKALLKEKVNHE
jgi:LmbE family N-acetylglucosaminyl deacetylase